MTCEPGGLTDSIGISMDADDFALFGLPLQFAQDSTTIDARWKALQLRVHPDRFASFGGSASRLAMQWAIRVNEARQRLKSPLSRAAYLCRLHGQETGAENRQPLPAGVLLQQMEWRERVEQATTEAQLDAVSFDVDAHSRHLQATLVGLLDEQRDWAAAGMQVTVLMFMERLRRDIEKRRDSL